MTTHQKTIDKLMKLKGMIIAVDAEITAEVSAMQPVYTNAPDRWKNTASATQYVLAKTDLDEVQDHLEQAQGMINEAIRRLHTVEGP